MKWNGRSYRPSNAQFITKKKPFDFQEALKPYGEKEMPVWNAIVAVNTESENIIPTTPTPTPSNTPTGTPASTTTPTPTNTQTPTPTPTNTETPTTTPTPTNTTTPTTTPTQTQTPTCGTFTTQYLKSEIQGNDNIKFTLFNNPDYTGNANALCDYTIVGSYDITSGAINVPYSTIMANNDHTHTYSTGAGNISGFTISSVTPVCPCVNVVFIPPTPTPTPTNTQTPTGTPNQTPTPNPTGTPTPTPTILPGTSEANSYLSAVVAAGGTLNSTISGATRTLFQSIWSNGFNNGMLYMYPFIGGTAGSNKFNALNPVDTNAGYRLTFNGGWTHSSSGATPNGVNAYANTFFTPNSASTLTISGGTLGFYSGTDSVGAFSKCAMGSKGDLSNGWALYPKSNADVIDAFAWENDTGAPTTATNPNSLGGLAFTRTGTTQVSYVRRGTLFETVNKASIAKSPQPIYLGALNSDGTDGQYSVFRQQFNYAHTGLTVAQITTLDTIIQTYQTSLSRNTY
jgi:hypothetical protein